MPTKWNPHSCSLDTAIKAPALNGYFFLLIAPSVRGGMAFTSAVNSQQARLDVREKGVQLAEGFELGQPQPPPVHTGAFPAIVLSLKMALKTKRSREKKKIVIFFLNNVCAI